MSDRLSRELSAKVGDELFKVTLAVLALLFVLWAVLLALLTQFQRQADRRFAAERELSRQEERYERLVNNLSQYFVYRKDANGRLVSVSDSVQRVLGFLPAEFAARHSESLRRRSDSTQADPSFEVGLDDSHGVSHRVELSEVPELDDKGRVIAYDGIARDVTTERRFREELRHAKEDAESANQAKSHFLANMSHEIRTPLNAILGMAGLALRSVREPRERDYLEKIKTSARLLVEIIEDILDLSRIEGGRLDLANESFDVEEMLAEVADVIGVKAGARGLEVLFQPEGRLPRRLVGDVVRLKQILLNLLNNAVKFTERGEIVVKIEAIEARRDRAALRFTVTDTGIGISEANVGSLFEPFTQVDSSSARRYGGVGLGLAISRRLVRLMGGEISVKSRLGEGSVFTFTATFGISPDSVEARRLPESLIGLHALVVDDNESARLALAGMLEMLACRVDTAGSGEEAVKVFKHATESEPYRVALVDWKMPGLDGIETSTRLREIAGTSPLGLILVTAYDWDEAARRAEGAGIDTVLHKPLSPSALHDALVSTLMPGERLRAHAPSTSLTTFVPGQTVLLVEDQAINRELARELLTQAGLLVREAANGAEALRALDDQRPDVVLMDVQMPDMDGLTAVGRIRANPNLKGLPVIAMTAHAMLGDKERFLAAGMSDYVAKPIEESQLFRVLSRWLKAELLTHGAPGREALETDAPPSTRTLAALDRGAGLRRAGGNAALFDRLVRAFVTEAPEMAARIRRKTAEGDAEGARRELHTLKGNAATVSALETAALAGALERSPDARLPISAIDDLDRAIERLGFEVGAAADVVPKAAPERPVLPLTPEARAALRSALRKVADHVAKGNLAARRSFEEVERVAAGNFAAPLRSIADALARLDFTAAASEIEAVESQLTSLEEP